MMKRKVYNVNDDKKTSFGFFSHVPAIHVRFRINDSNEEIILRVSRMIIKVDDYGILKNGFAHKKN